VRVVGYDTSGGTLLVSDRADGTGRGRPVEPMALEPGTELAYGLGDRRCPGAVHDGRHHPCDEPRPRHEPGDRPVGPHCEAHGGTWVCARCRGDCLKPEGEKDCFEPHAVYLAAFAPASFKVGVTRAARLERRLREQGADRGVHLESHADGELARRREAALAEQVAGIGHAVAVADKRAGLGRTVDEAAWERLLDGFDVRTRHAFEYGLALEGPATPATLAAGTVRGTKGRLLVLDRGGTTHAVDLRDLVGHELRPGGPSRDRQAGLGAF
jgi:hypothetical protein